MESTTPLRPSVLVLLLLAGCGTLPPPPPLPPEAHDCREFLLDADRPWTSTGISVEAGQVVEFWATGRVEVTGWAWMGNEGESIVGPEGTYFYPDPGDGESFPLAAGRQGPAPPFSLVARIGPEGRPFLVGPHRSIEAPISGVIELAVNDFDPSDNDGALRVGIRLGAPGETAAPGRLDARPWIEAAGRPRPVEDARVLIVYVDGLRYDVLKEMAFAGYLPTIRRLFFDGGTDVDRTFTINPSDTVVCTSAFLTASWPDRSGLFTQMHFDRETGEYEYFLSALGPSDVGRRFEPDWWQRPFVVPDGPALLGERVEAAGHAFRSTVLPVLTIHPPDLFFHRLSNVAPLFGAHLVKDFYIDRIQTAYALEKVVLRDSKVMMVWYSGVDTAGHRTARGLWGEARRDLAHIDADLALFEEKLRQEGIADRTTWILYADHGSAGGKHLVSQSYDLANDFFYESLADDDGDRRADVDAGLGFNVFFQVNDVPLVRKHTDFPQEDFMLCMTQAYSVAWCALPRGAIESRDWSINRYHDLTRYRVHPDLEPVDIPRRLLEARSPRPHADPERAGERPVQLVLIPVAADSVLVLGQGGTRAVIQRRRDVESEERRFQYRYAVVRDLISTPDGVEYVEEDRPSADPFDLVASPGIRARLAADPGWMSAWHGDREWLAATAESAYPDCIVSYSHALLDDPLAPRIDRRHRYDFVVVASRGWNFGSGRHRLGVDHGGPYREAVHIPFLVSGPNIAKGARVRRPARIIDIVPTVLEIAGIPYDPASFDGRPVREIWAEPSALADGGAEPVPFHVDDGLPMPAVDTRTKHGLLAHDFEAWHDPHNLAADLGALSSQEVVRLGDFLADLVIPGDPLHPLSTGLGAFGEAYDRLPDGKLKRRPAQLFAALRLRNITVGEINDPVKSLQHVDRAAMTIDWVQDVLHDPFEAFLPPGINPLLPVDFLLDHVVDGILDLRRSLLELVARGMEGAVGGIEQMVRDTSEALDREDWETPRMRPRASMADQSARGR